MHTSLAALTPGSEKQVIKALLFRVSLGELTNVIMTLPKLCEPQLAPYALAGATSIIV